MSHLNAETLARLIDEDPDALEAAHLSGCDTCRAELDAMRSDVQALAELGRQQAIEPPAAAWASLRDRLIDEGLVHTVRRRTPAYMQIAAALALFLTGTAAGFTWRGATLPPGVAVAPATAVDADTPTSDARSSEDAGTDAQQTASSNATSQLASNDTDAPAPSDDVRAPGAGGDDLRGSRTTDAGADARAVAPARLARDDTPATDVPDTEVRTRQPAGDPRTGESAARSEPRITGPVYEDPRFAMQPYGARNAQEAATMLRDAEGMYLDALAQYAQLSGDPSDIEDPVARLVALESIVLTTREALDRAPADPIINGYHMTAVAQRDATLRQLAARSRDPWF